MELEGVVQNGVSIASFSSGPWGLRCSDPARRRSHIDLNYLVR